MSTTFEGKVNFGGIFHPTGATPLDDRMVVDKKDDLATLGSTVYRGMVVSVRDDKAIYYLDADVCTDLDKWIKIGGEEQTIQPVQWEDITE